MISNDPVLALILNDTQQGREYRRLILDACKAAGSPLSAQAIFAWGALKSGVPPRRAGIVARVLGISELQVRPDIFSAPPGFVPVPLPKLNGQTKVAKAKVAKHIALKRSPRRRYARGR